MIDFLRRHYIKAFLIFIVSYLLLEPFAEHVPILYQFVIVQSYALMLFGPYVVTRSKVLLYLCLVMVAVIIYANIIDDFGQVQESLYVKGIAIVTLCSFVTGFLFWHTVTMVKVVQDTLLSSICIYLMIGITFSIIYSFIEVIAPGSFDLGEGVRFTGGLNNSDFMYFSYTTITTLGYGDVVPLSPIAKRLTSLEACLGILYVGLFIGILISQFKKEKS